MKLKYKANQFPRHIFGVHVIQHEFEIKIKNLTQPPLSFVVLPIAWYELTLSPHSTQKKALPASWSMHLSTVELQVQQQSQDMQYTSVWLPDIPAILSKQTNGQNIVKTKMVLISPWVPYTIESAGTQTTL